jgi:hypothetical protein
MLPASYATPAAAVLAIGGLLACFAGYRLFRAVLGMYGLILGAMITSSWMGASSTWTLIVAAVVGGILGAVLMIAAYFVGVGLIGAGLAALVINLVWLAIGGEPPTLVLVVGCVLGALGALSVVRYVVVAGTSIAGAWTAIVGVVALFGDRDALRAASAGDVWVFYPLDPIPDRWWYTVIWVALSVVGAAVQITTAGKGGGRRRRVKKEAA